MGLDPAALVTAEQVHGDHIAEVGAADVGRGATAASGPAAVPATDALMTSVPGMPLLMMYADCVPVVLVAREPVRAVAVVHAGWKGAFASLPGKAAVALAGLAGCGTDRIDAYVGPHIGPCHYEVDEALATAFGDRFGPGVLARYDASPTPKVDLGTAVSRSLVDAGVSPERIATLGLCTAEHLDLFYSYRAEGLTGRHGAVAAILARA
jgi:YfiH family protein